MRISDLDEGAGSEPQFDVESGRILRDDRSAARPIAVALIASGIAGTIGLHAWQLGRYGGPADMWSQLVFALAFSLLSAAVTAGVVLLVLELWLVPLLERLIGSAPGVEHDPVDRHGGGRAGGSG